MTRTLAVLLILSLAGPAAAVEKLAVKVEDTPPPKELAEPVRKLLDTKALSVSDEKGKLLCTVWPRKTLEAKAGADANALKYTSLDETALLGVVRFPETWVDYRKQKIKAGVYTLRLAMQPMDGDHMGTAPYSEFALLVPAEQDKTPDLMDPMDLHGLSAKATGRKHPGIMLMFPNPKPAEAPEAAAKPQETWVLSFRTPVSAGGKTASLGFSLVVVGVSTAE